MTEVIITRKNAPNGYFKGMSRKDSWNFPSFIKAAWIASLESVNANVPADVVSGFPTSQNGVGYNGDGTVDMTSTFLSLHPAPGSCDVGGDGIFWLISAVGAGLTNVGVSMGTPDYFNIGYDPQTDDGGTLTGKLGLTVVGNNGLYPTTMNDAESTIISVDQPAAGSKQERWVMGMYQTVSGSNITIKARHEGITYTKNLTYDGTGTADMDQPGIGFTALVTALGSQIIADLRGISQAQFDWEQFVDEYTNNFQNGDQGVSMHTMCKELFY